MSVDWSKRFDSSYRFVRVDRITGRETELLTGFKTGGSLQRNLDTEIKESGSVDYVGAFSIGADLVRVYLDAKFTGGDIEHVCLGTFLATTSSRTAKGSVSSSTINLSGRLKELADNAVVSPICISEGTNLVAAAKQIIEEASLTVISDDSQFTNSSPLYYGVQGNGEQGSASSDSKLAMVNDLLQRAGFNSANTDVYGNVLLTRAVPIEQRPISWEFIEGKQARFLREMSEEYDTSQVANVVYTVYTKDDSQVIGIAEDNDPNSPFSFQAIGRYISAKYEYQDEATQEVADAKAQELLSSARAVLRKETIKHIYAPITLGDAVLLTYRTAGVQGKFSVRTMRINLVAGCLCESEVRAYGR